MYSLSFEDISSLSDLPECDIQNDLKVRCKHPLLLFSCAVASAPGLLGASNCEKKSPPFTRRGKKKTKDAEEDSTKKTRESVFQV